MTGFGAAPPAIPTVNRSTTTRENRAQHIDFMADSLTCRQFSNVIMRRTEHLQDDILKDITPINSMTGMVETGSWKAFSGTSRTRDKFNRVAVDQHVAWSEVSDVNCVGTPCDPSETEICFGSTRIEYGLEKKSFRTQLVCYDQILTLDRAVEFWANAYQQLRDVQELVIENRYMSEYFRVAENKWVAQTNALTPFTFTEVDNLITLTVSALPTAGMVVNMLKRRLQHQILTGSSGRTPMGGTPQLEVLTSMETIWELLQGNSNLTDHWQFQAFEAGSKEYDTYGWAGRVGNFMLKAALRPLRFQINPNGTLTQVFPYTNIPSSSGIKGIVNQTYIDAPVEALAIWNRRVMRQLVLDTAQVNPNMPFSARSLGGKWQFVQNNLTCGLDVNGNPVAVDNSRMNKGRWISDYEFATDPQFPEYGEVFLFLRAPPCIVASEPCGLSTAYPEQNYDSSCDGCETETTTLTVLPIKDSGGTYEIIANSIQCNGITIAHSAITGTSTLAALVVQLNLLVSTLGTWAVSGPNITLVGTACTSIAMPWTEV
jgi:hypothetical protein